MSSFFEKKVLPSPLELLDKLGAPNGFLGKPQINLQELVGGSKQDPKSATALPGAWDSLVWRDVSGNPLVIYTARCTWGCNSDNNSR
jgi:hypothetical protein